MSRPVRDARSQAVVAQVAARLLDYPDDDLVRALPLLRAAVEAALGPDDDVRTLLVGSIDDLGGRSLLTWQQEYVATFDLKRRCCLYLTYYLNGDTRRRGMALWRFQETFRLAGFALGTGELPDYLPVVLEFAAAGGEAAQAAAVLLDEHREGLEVLRAALERFSPAYANVVQAVTAVRPSLTPAQREAATRLVAQGPPTESVGLEPFTLVDISSGARA